VSDRRDDLLDEAILRRALRLEPDERSPVFDAAAIAAAARPRTRLAVISALVAVGLGAAGALTAWWAAAILAPAIVASAFDLVLGIVAVAAVPATTILGIAQQPAVPLSLLAAIAVAIAHELRERNLASPAVR
jgi:hypothetical protein